MVRTKNKGRMPFMSLLLALCMALTLFSAQAFAASETDPGDTDPPQEETGLPTDPPEQEAEPGPIMVDVLGVELPACDVVYNGSSQPYPHAGLFTGLEGVKSADISYTGTLPNGNAYELPAPPVDAGSYTVRLALTAEDAYTLNADRIEAQMTISKAPQSMPNPPLIAGRTISTITLTEVSGAEYSMDGGETWQDSPRFTGLSPDTAYRFTQRMKEADNFLPSDSQTVEARTVADTGLRYEIDFFHEAIYFDTSVVAVSTDRNMTALLTNGASIEPGAVLYLRLIDSGTGEPGSITAETMPDRPDAPEVKADLHTLTVNTTRSMECSVNGGKTWERCALDMGVSDWTGKKLLVRVAATSNQFSSEAAEISIPARGEKPSVALDTVAETISTTTDMDCSTDNGKTWTPCTGPLDVSALTGADILLRFPGSSAAPPSDTATVKIPARRRAPAVTGTSETRLGYRDGALVRTERGMEYRITGGNWTEITGSTVAPLAPGTYEVRYAATEAEFVSEIQKVVIAKGELAVAPDSKLSLLNRQDHIAYIVGRTSTQAAPNADITRAEVVTILYRLLTQEAKANYGTSAVPFQDVSVSAWYGPAVATLANMEVLNIYPGGTFEPNRKITRGELAAILASFCGTAEDSGRDRFSDISGNWARRYINQAAEAGLIYGYTDGTFRPDQNITRAETIVMVNRILGRSASADTVLRGYKTFSDVPTGAWYYWDIVEASNPHGFQMNGSTEKWTAIG